MNNDNTMHRFALPSGAEVDLNLEDHLGRLKLGRHFEVYEARWSEPEARHFVAAIEELCDIVDRVGPAILDDICARRRSALGLNPARGRIIRAHRAQNLATGGNAGRLDPFCSVLWQSVKDGRELRFSQKGCRLFLAELDRLRTLACETLPQLINEAEFSSCYGMDRFDLALA